MRKTYVILASALLCAAAAQAQDAPAIISGTSFSVEEQKSRMADELTNSNELVNVYNVQGMLVKESVKKSAINELPAGLYIVDGKKVVIR